MKRLSVVFLLFITIALTGFGQSFFEKVDLGIDKFKYSKLDTNYIAPPTYKLMVAVESKNFWNHDNIHIPFSWTDPDIYETYPGLENYETEEILSRTSQTSLNLRVSYCGFSASYAFTLNGKGSRKAFALGSNGNKFGFKMGFERNSLNNARFRDYRYLPLMYTFLDAFYEAGAIDKHYTIDEIAHHSVYERDDIIDEEEEAKIGENDMWELDDIIRWYGNFYYAFNHRKFSMSAANYAQYIQKRSAGSFFVTGDVNFTRLHAHDLLNTSNDTIRASRERFSAFGIALGAGYGYNWTPNHGKFLLHGSIRPMIDVYSRMDYDAHDWVHDDEGNVKKVKMERIPELQPLYDHKMKLTFGGVARVAAVWNISPRIVTGANMELTIRDNRNSKDYRMYNSCLNLNAYFAMRFIKNKRRY